MTDEVKEMLSKALRDEPPVRVTYDSVLAAGKRRRTRRQLAITGGAALSVAAVVSAAMLVAQWPETTTLTPAGPTSAVPEPAAGCAFPLRTAGFSDLPDGNASAEELAESARLTEAFAGFAVPLPAGVTMDPAKPRFCVIKESWGTQVVLHSAAGDRALFIEVKPANVLAAGLCPAPDRVAVCSIRKLADGGTARITQTVGQVPNLPVLVDVWRSDGTVRIMETGTETPKPAPRILDDDALIKIASAGALTVSGPMRKLLPEVARQRAAALTDELIKSGVLGPRVLVTSGFQASEGGGYKLSIDVSDSAGVGNLVINLTVPDSAASVDCHNEPGCSVQMLPDKRKAAITRYADKTSMRLSLSTIAADGTQVSITTTNHGSYGPTRPTPPLTDDDLIRIAGQAWLHR
jgi:hypothetical protein